MGVFNLVDDGTTPGKDPSNNNKSYQITSTII